MGRARRIQAPVNLQTLALLAVLASGASAAPVLTCEQAVHRFGVRHDEHGTVSNTFVLINTAPRPVRVSLISAGCGCTVISLTNREVAAGGRVEIPASLGLRGRRGPVSKRFLVKSAPPDESSLLLGFEGVVDPAVTVQPEQLLFGRLLVDAKTNLFATIRFRAGLTDRVDRVTVEGQGFTGVVEEASSGAEYRIRVNTSPPLPIGGGMLRAAAKAYTASGREIVVPMLAEVIQEIPVALPAEIMLPADGDESRTRYLVVRPGRRGHVAVLGVDVPDPAIKAGLMRLGRQGGWRVELRNLPSRADLVGQLISIRTDDAARPEIAVPLRAPRERE